MRKDQKSFERWQTVYYVQNGGLHTGKCSGFPAGPLLFKLNSSWPSMGIAMDGVTASALCYGAFAVCTRACLLRVGYSASEWR